ncbi:DUF6153 family protein [Enemella evansiae]|uniref:DUF6153 family protein n=1 Tax=Enemella evansiae TaxID=2016499 RepID=UPI00117FFEF3|nr:DUF6153 family protein [Enemella evansiae]
MPIRPSRRPGNRSRLVLLAGGIIAALVFGLLAMHQLSSHHRMVTGDTAAASTGTHGSMAMSMVGESAPMAMPATDAPAPEQDHQQSGGMFWSCLLVLVLGLLLWLVRPRLRVLTRLHPVRLSRHLSAYRLLLRPRSLAELCVLRT